MNQFAKKLLPFSSLLFLVSLWTFLMPDTFLTLANFRNVLGSASASGIIAAGMTFVIITTGIDLSVGSMLALCGMAGAAAMLALSGLRDPKEMFAQVLGQHGYDGVSTFYGYYMIEAMSAADESQRALNTVRDYWGAMLDVGATSFWEDFKLSWTNNCFRIDEMPVAGKKDIHGDYGEFCYPGFRHSLCHGWAGGPAAWCINHVLGIRPLDVGCKTVEVKPFLGDLEWAEGAMALPDGTAVKVKIRKLPDGKVDVKINSPDWVRIVE